MATTTKCNCYYCGKTVGKGQIKAHLLKELPPGDEECCLVKIESAYSKYFWMYVDAPLTATLKQLDAFMRKIWLECCGHMSEFYDGPPFVGETVSMSKKLGALWAGASLGYVYDMGTSTELLVTIVGKTSRPKQKNAVRLLARNEEPEVAPCHKCGKPGKFLSVWDGYEVLCEECVEDYDADGCLPIVNSPRCGECGYDGEYDIYEFNPNKLLCGA